MMIIRLFRPLQNGQLITDSFEKIDGGGFTVEFWIQFNSSPAGFTNLVGDGEGGMDFMLMVYAGSGGFIRPHVQTNSGFASIDSVDRITDNDLHHIVATWDEVSGELHLYIDGELANTTISAGTIPTSGQPINSDNPIYIGQDGREPRAPDALIDEVAIYNYALSAERILAHFNAVEIPEPPEPPEDLGGIAVGESTLIGALDYSDSFTIGENAINESRKAYAAQRYPLPVGVEVIENSYGNPTVSWPSNYWSIARDHAVNPGGFGYFGGNGAGSNSGMTQRGGGGDWSIAYGIRDVFIIQSDFVQLPDRVDFTVGGTPNTIGGADNLNIFFRQTGTSPWFEIGIYNSLIGEKDTGLSSDIAVRNVTLNTGWNNYALLVDVGNEMIEAFVNEESKGVIDLNVIHDGAYAGILNNSYIGIGGAGSDRLWSDDFQVGSPALNAALEIIEISYSPVDSNLSVSWNSNPGKNYALDFSFDLLTWLELNDEIVSDGELTTYQETLSEALPENKRSVFFRVREVE
ncbi:MAG: LamG domain-containing protein [Verrucomicrobiales bacterium]|nr:LamG domain-containing protein [Verrucomicrobiales bacterium]